MILLAIGLAALAGFVDALGFMSIGGFFVSFMSGNSTHLAVAATSMDWPTVRQAGMLILVFVAGVMAGTLIANAVPTRRKAAVLGAVTVLLTAAAAAHMLAIDRVALLIVAAAMGTENAVFQRDGEVSIGLTYVTGTLVRFAQHAALALIGKRDRIWVRYAALWLGLIAGAVAGSHAYMRMGLHALWLAAALAALMTGVADRLTPQRH